jgi:hypothetical protein
MRADRPERYRRSQSIQDVARDWTRDAGRDGPFQGTAAVRGDYLYRPGSGEGRLDRSSVLFAWATGQVLQAFSQISVAGGPAVDPSPVEQRRTAGPR